MKKMLLAGCSHSVGYGLENVENSWGNIFAKNNGYELTNVAVSASSLQYSIQAIIDNIHKTNYDVVLFQLTTFDRYPISYNGDVRFVTDNILKVDTTKRDVFHMVPANYLEAVNGGKLPVKVENIRFFYEEVMYSTFYINTIINEIYILQELLKCKGIDFILIPYDDYFWGYESYMNIWRLEQSHKINKSRYVDYPFMKWLKDNYNPDDYYLDKGFHLNLEGHKLFAEEYLPSLIKVN